MEKTLTLHYCPGNPVAKRTRCCAAKLPLTSLSPKNKIRKAAANIPTFGKLPPIH